MLQIKPQNDKNKLRELYCSAGVEFSENSVGIEARDGESLIGYCLFSVDGGSMIIAALEPLNDVALADGILRSALYVGTCRNVTEAYYTDNGAVEKLLTLLGFVEDEQSKRININKIFHSCESCQNG